jgi:hypothetical protein
MPRNPESETRKKQIVSVLRCRLGSLDRNHPHRSDWYSSEDGSVEVFITDSKAHFDQRPWFDMKNEDIKELAKHPDGFIIFVLGDDTNYLVVPAKHLLAELPNYNERITEDGRYHFNIVLGEKGFKQLPNWNLQQYRNRIELIPSISTALRLPAIVCS